MQIHNLKTDKTLYHDVLYDKKRFEQRVDDRDFEVGDLLNLQAWDRDTQQYADQQQYAPILCRVTYLLHDYECRGLRDGFVVMGIERVKIETSGITYRPAPE